MPAHCGVPALVPPKLYQLVAPAAAVASGEQPYFSLLLIRQGLPEVLP